MMRRRHTLLPLSETAEKSQWMSGKYSSIFLLATLSALFWSFLLYFNLILISGNYGVADYNSQSESSALEKKSPAVTNPTPSTTSGSLNIHRSGFYSAKRGGKFSNDKSRAESSNLVKSKDPKRIRSEDHNLNQGTKSYPFMRALRTVENKSDPCGGRYIYVHKLPPMFNEDMVKDCKDLNPWENMCKFLENGGLGKQLEDHAGVLSNTSWYATNQFTLDAIFNNRMKQYECLTNDSSVAAAIYVPFYAGFDAGRYLWGDHNVSTKDAMSHALIDWLTKRPEWRITGGRDHFLVGGRITWDFRRGSDEERGWGNKLQLLPEVRNMSMLVIESSPWDVNDHGIPYPTYFHPAKDGEVISWQGRMRKLQRKNLFCFAGAPRPGDAQSIRDQILNQCNNSKQCKLMDCGSSGNASRCYSPSNVIQMFQSSVFCLQPQGDSFTRRSTFDSILAGCIPVFFHPGSAYTQYIWHFPKDYSEYSVFIPDDDVRKNVSIEERLSRISSDKVKRMREAVIDLIPRVIYADPRAKLETLKDAFDISVEGVIDKVTKLRKDIINGRKEDHNEKSSWKDAVVVGKAPASQEWHPSISKPENGGKSS